MRRWLLLLSVFSFPFSALPQGLEDLKFHSDTRRPVNTVGEFNFYPGKLLVDGVAVVGGGGAWGAITGSITAQADLASALNAKLATNGNGSSLTGLTKAQVGLGNVDNTSDVSKPVSTAQATANSAVASTAATALATHTGNTSNPHVVTKAQVGLGNVDNTSDVNKPVSSAQQSALNAKAFVNAGASFDVLTDISTGNIDTFQSVVSVFLPAGLYAVDFSGTVRNPTAIGQNGSQWTLAAESTPLVIVTDADTDNGADVLSSMLPPLDDDGIGGLTGGMSFDAPAHGSFNEHVTTGVLRNPTGQNVTLKISTNAGATLATGSFVRLRPQNSGLSASWSGITGTLSAQTDLQTALNAKLSAASNLSDIPSAAAARANLGVASVAQATANDSQASATTVTPDSSKDVFTLSTVIAATITFANPTAGTKDGQPWLWHLKENGTGSHTKNFGTSYKFPASGSAAQANIPGSANANWWMRWVWDAGQGKWVCVAISDDTQ